MSADVIGAIVGASVAAFLSLVGLIIRASVQRWIRSLTTLVNARGDNVEGQVQQVATHVILLDDKITSVQMSNAEIRGKLGLPVERALIENLPVRR
jgi:hypothetical protein